jgi:ribosomal protein S18 acetylase RimI-like enzyme
MQFEAFNPKKHNRSDFDCGVKVLNTYLRQFANQDQKRNLTKVTVLCEGEHVIGYSSMSAHSVEQDELARDKKMGSYSAVPFLLLGRLAVDVRHQRQGYGEALVFHACTTTVRAAQQVGIFGMVVDAKDERAASFYEGLGFQKLRRTTNRLVMPVSVMAEIISKCSKQL